jgi:hypothetical protein
MTQFTIETLSPANQREPAQIDLLGYGPVRLLFEHPKLGHHETSADDAFEALVQLRLWLEPTGYKLLCAGARRDVYPSPMSRQMSGGISAYKMIPGKPATRDDLVKILDPATPDQIGTVAEQESFHKQWLGGFQNIPKSTGQEITPDLLEAAKKIPNGYVYKLDGQFGPNETVPPEAIIGAWKVNESGNIIGDFIPNQNYRPRLARDLVDTKVTKPSE